jgi:hypothetical protein
VGPKQPRRPATLGSHCTVLFAEGVAAEGVPADTHRDMVMRTGGVAQPAVEASSGNWQQRPLSPVLQVHAYAVQLASCPV